LHCRLLRWLQLKLIVTRCRRSGASSWFATLLQLLLLLLLLLLLVLLLHHHRSILLLLHVDGSLLTHGKRLLLLL